MATKGNETKFAYGNGATHTASSSWTEFASITDIQPPTAKADDIDVSHMQSGDFKEFDPGLAEGGEVELTIQFDKEQNEDVYGLFRVKKGFKLTFSDGSSWSLTGYISEFGNEVDREGIVTAKIKVKVSGQPEFAKAA
ncbi:MAG: phage tail tube protein [Tepidisphaeraceae bacterium]